MNAHHILPTAHNELAPDRNPDRFGSRSRGTPALATLFASPGSSRGRPRTLDRVLRVLRGER